MRGQASIEYFVMIGMIIAAISVLAAMAWQENEISTRFSQAQVAAKMIASTAETIYAQGPGSKSSISVIIPSGYSPSSSSVQDNRITLAIQTSGGTVDVIALTKANVSGSPPSGPGLKNIDFEIIEGYVNITSS